MNIGTVHLHTNDVLLYLALAYTIFFVVIFAYTISLSRRQARVQSDLTLLRRALDEEQTKG